MGLTGHTRRQKGFACGRLCLVQPETVPETEMLRQDPETERKILNRKEVDWISEVIRWIMRKTDKA